MEQGGEQRKTGERIAILKRLKTHLLGQRDKFQNYLELLDKEEESIRSGDLNSLAVQVEFEKSIVEEIYSFQKVIDPLQELYRAVYPTPEGDVPPLAASLEHLRSQVLARNEHNRLLLRESMAHLRQEIKALRLPRQAKSPYGDVDAPSVIDIHT